MKKVLWTAFALTQIVGVALLYYGWQFDEWSGDLRALLWIPAHFLLFPGGLIACFVASTQTGAVLLLWHAIPLSAATVAGNGICYIAASRIAKRNTTR